jgi:hypothetical protein
VSNIFGCDKKMNDMTKKLQKIVAHRKTKKVVSESKYFNPYRNRRTSSTPDYYNNN